MPKLKRKVKRRLKFFIFLLIVGSLFVYAHYQEQIKITNPQQEQSRIEEEERQRKLAEYEECLTKEYSEEELSEELTQQIAELTKFIQDNNYKASVYFEDITTGFTYTYDAQKVYYGCSLIKLVDALYLINKASNKELDLDSQTIKYTSNYKADYSSGMATRNIGEEISLRDLITYAITLSDNTAHLMLIDYIGFDNLKEYGQSLGAKVILTGGDKFGNQTAEDTNIYLKEAYRIITEDKEYGPYLKNLMDNDERNAFNTEDIKIYHKYGSYDIYYHDIGLSLEEHPYAISILTLHEYSNYESVVQNIHEKVRELQASFYENRENICQELVYSESETTK